MTWTHDDLIELLGAYALDAVEPDERDAIDAHLPSCPRCAQEVAEHREVAASLAAGAPAPDGLWNRIAANLEETPPALDLESVGRPARRPAPPATPSGVVAIGAARSARLRRWLPAAAVAAAMLIVGLVAGVTVVGGDGADRTDVAAASLENLARDVLNDPGAHKVSLQSESGELSAPAAIAADGSGYLLGTSLPALDEGQTYQLWAVSDTGVVSVGVLGASPGVVAFHVDDGVRALAITTEVAGGVVSSANTPVLVGEL